MKIQEALVVADRVLDVLRPVSLRVEVAGSVSRRRTDVGDLEVVCIPGEVACPDLFVADATCRSQAWIRAVDGLGLAVKGDPVSGKYIQVTLAEGINLDLFLARTVNWGLILAIRTGSARFSHEVLARGWCAAGYRSSEGMLWAAGRPVPVREEAELFEKIHQPWVEPRDRE